MGASLIGNTLAVVSGTFYIHQQIPYEDKTLMTSARSYWDYCLRNPVTLVNRFQYDFVELWPTASMLGDNGAAVSWMGNNNTGGAYQSYETWAFGEGGTYRPKQISGIIYQSDGVTPQPGAIVELYLTSTNAPVAVATSGQDGSYSIGTPFTGQNHYVVAYLAGTPDVAGTSVNTLTPS